MKAVHTRPKGTNDFWGREAELVQHVVETASAVFGRAGFKPVFLPLFEHTEVFARGIGEATDIVGKEMYTFQDRKGRSLTLRPEGTASVVRAYIQNDWARARFNKVWYWGPMFRYERPQAGRYRQFHQIGLEYFASPDAMADVDVMMCLVLLLEELGIGGLKISLNSVGCPACRPGYRDSLLSFLQGREGDLCADCRRRMELNPLRILDCKKESCRAIVRDAPSLQEHLCGECRAHHSRVLKLLDAAALAWEEDASLVRGLDYYTRTAFEVRSSELGAQSEVGGGGRYDMLVEQLGGRPTPAVGFALGLERVVMLLASRQDDAERSGGPAFVYVAYVGDEYMEHALRLVALLRRRGYRAEMEPRPRKLSRQMSEASRGGADVVVIFAEHEYERGFVSVKEMKEGRQREVPIPDLQRYLDESLAC